MATIGALIYKMGLDVSELTENVKTANNKLDGLAAGAQKFGRVLAGAFAVGGVAAAVTQFTEFASTINDLSLKTGIGVEGLQRLKFAAEQNGATLDQVAGAVTKLGDKLVSGDKSAVQALGVLGLRLDEIRRMQPDQAFIAIGDAVAKIEDPMVRSKLAIDLFGRAGADLLPMMRGNLTETAAAAERLGLVLDEQTIKAGDEFGDVLDVLKAQGMALMAQVLKPLLPVLIALAQGFAQVASIVANLLGKALEYVMRAFLLAGKYIDLFLANVAEAAMKIPVLGKHLGFAAGAAEWFRADAAKADEALAKLGATSTSAAPAIGKLGAPLTLAGNAAKKTKGDLDSLAESVQKFALQLDAAMAGGRAAAYLAEFGKQIEDVVRKARALGVAVPEALATAADLSFVTRTLAQAGQQIRDLAQGLWSDIAEAAEAAGKRTTEAWAKAMSALGTLTTSVLGRTTSALERELGQVAQWAEETTAALRAAGIEDQRIFDAVAAEAGQRMDQIRQDHADMAQGMEEDILSWGSLFKGVLDGIPAIFQAAFEGGGGVLGAMKSLTTKLFSGIGSKLLGGATGLGNTIVQGLNKVFGSGVAQIVGSFLPGIGALLGPLMGKAVDWFTGLFGQAGKTRKMRDAWIAQAGGLDQVRKMAEYAGVSIDKLLNTKKTKDFEKEVQKLEAAYKKVQERVQKLTGDLAQLGKTGALMTTEMLQRLRADRTNPDVQAAAAEYLTGQTDRGLGALDRLLKSTAPLTTGAIQGMVGAVGSFYQQLLELGVPTTEALARMGDVIDGLSQKLGEAGIGGGEAFDRLREMAGLAKDEVAGPLLQSISDVVELMTAAANTGWLDQSMFQQLASQVGASWAKLEAEGKATDAAFAAIVPDLQKLWEMQRRLGYAVDETTQGMIDQAVANGQVGDQFLSAQDRSALALEKLLDRFDLLLNAMGVQVPRAADQMARSVTDAVNRIPRRVPIEVEFTGMPEGEWTGGPLPPAELPGYASGGIAWSPQVARVAEQEPEAIIPLSKLGALGGISVTLQLLGGVGLTEDQMQSLEAQGSRIGKAIASAAWRNESGLRLDLQHALGVS